MAGQSGSDYLSLTMYKQMLFLLFIVFSVQNVVGQQVPYHHSNNRVYGFLEEMASLKTIQLNNVTLPLSRRQIHDYLSEVNEHSDKLNARQKKDLLFYRQEFIKESDDHSGYDFLGRGLKRGAVFPLRKREKRYDLGFYKGSLFSVTVNPIFGGEGFLSGNRFYYQRSIGARIYGNVSEHFSFYAELRDNSETVALSDESHLTRRLGVNYKADMDHSEMRGGIVASSKWGSLSLVKDHVVWGSNYNGSNILAGRTPSFPMIKLHLSPVKWFSLDYIHAWLVSDMVDSAASYVLPSGYREVMRSKYLAANLFTVRPFKQFYFSFGNSIVYADRFNPVYLIPFLFYKSVDHTLNSTSANSNFGGQNSQMFINIVSRQIRCLQIYGSVFVDEIRLSTMFDKTESRNQLSWKVGARFTSPGNLNLSLILEYTRNNPMAYRHFVQSITFESNSYRLGSYLGDNADEFYVGLIYKPLSRLRMIASFNSVRKGQTYAYAVGKDGTGLPFISEVRMRRYDAQLKINYSVAQDVNVFIGYRYLTENGPEAYLYLPDPFSTDGPHHVSFGLSIGY